MVVFKSEHSGVLPLDELGAAVPMVAGAMGDDRFMIRRARRSVNLRGFCA